MPSRRGGASHDVRDVVRVHDPLDTRLPRQACRHKRNVGALRQFALQTLTVKRDHLVVAVVGESYAAAVDALIAKRPLERG